VGYVQGIGGRYVREETKDIWIRYREYYFEPVPAKRIGDILIRDEVDPSITEGEQVRRVFWMLDYSAQLVYDTWAWKKEWRVDFVHIHIEDAMDGLETYRVEDATLDVVVEQMGPTYRMLDLDELSEKMEKGEYSLEQVSTIMKNTHRFLEAFLHRNAPWPPPGIAPLFSESHHYPKL
jgi:hypothetical protein